MGISAADLSTELSAVTFKCRGCSVTFNVSPARVVEDQSRAWHPWRYFADCTKCGSECEQAPWEVALMASFGKHTGPKSEEGKSVCARNIEGHPTPEEALRTRFNALKHGASARTAMFFPARPGKYDQCESCDIPHDVCRGNAACVKQTELFMRHRIAVENGDTSMLNDLHADWQANLRAIGDMAMLSVINKGVALETPVWYSDKDGGFHLAQHMNADGEVVQLTELNAHPLLKFIMELTAKNSLSLEDLAMTPKVADEHDALHGFLDAKTDQGANALDYQRKATDQMDKLLSLINADKRGTHRAPVTIDHDG